MWRISYFVADCERVGPTGQRVHGEVGHGPLRVGDRFTDLDTEAGGRSFGCDLGIVEIGPDASWLTVDPAEPALQRGDILMAELEDAAPRR